MVNKKEERPVHDEGFWQWVWCDAHACSCCCFGAFFIHLNHSFVQNLNTNQEEMPDFLKFFFKSVHFYYKMRKNYGSLHESMFCEEQASQLTLVNMSLFLKQCLFSNQWNIWSVFMCLCWSIKSKYYYKLIYSSVVIFYLLLIVWAAILICSAWSWGDFPDFPSRISKFAFS